MNSQIWPILTAIGAIIPSILLSLRYAYTQGRTDQRIKAIEEVQKSTGSVHSILAALTATVDGLQKSIERLDRAVERMSAGE